MGHLVELSKDSKVETEQERNCLRVLRIEIIQEKMREGGTERERKKEREKKKERERDRDRKGETEKDRKREGDR